MIKEVWEQPRATIEEFTPNEYIGVCVKAQIACYYPGADSTVVDGTTPTAYYDNYGFWDHKVFDNDAHPGYLEPHGLCGGWATITYDTDNNYSGYEFTDGSKNTNRPIDSVSYQGTDKGSHGNVTWTSTDNEYHTGTYHHKGELNILASGGNHS